MPTVSSRAGAVGQLRPLLLAELANPEWVSVPLVGWSLARAIMSRTNAHLVTQVRNRPAILRAGLTEGSEVTFIDNEAIAKPLYQFTKLIAGGKAWTFGTAVSTIAYYEFERQVWQQFGARIRGGEFDLVHRITPLTPVTPSIVAGRTASAGVPFVIGPMNGGVPWPREFRAAQHQEREWLSHVRGAYKLLPGHGATRRHASAVLVGSRHTLGLESTRDRDKCIYLPENGIDPERFTKQASIPDSGPLRVCFVGRLVPYKGVDMLLEAALPLLEQGEVEIDVVGDGQMLARLQEIAAGIGGKGIRLHGWLAHTQVQDVLAASHVLGFPSIREFGGGVVLEAMALGVVPMVVDYAGPAELVTPETGIKIALGVRESVVQGFRAALKAAAADRASLRRMSEAGRGLVHSKYTWDAKTSQVLDVYDWVRRGGSRPVLFTDAAGREPGPLS